MTKNSCSHPRKEFTFLASAPMPMAFRSLKPSLLTASLDRNKGVLSSMAAPRWVTKAHGIRRTPSKTKQGEDLSHEVNAAAVWVARKPPLGKEEPSVSPKKRRSYGNTALKGLVASVEDHSRSMSVSILKAPTAPPGAPPPPRIGKNQWAKETAPSSLAHLNMTSAKTCMSASLVGAPVTRASLKRLYTSPGSLVFMVASSKIAEEALVSASAISAL
mmetsp:Transcript_40928/g.96125  ORF Transcript_40928/g.96125 Transcript_40928/m.96125 type:complete len:217 (-) Transcript_40928:92-742(-)